MFPQLIRIYLLELAGTFALVFFAALAVCNNHLTTPLDQPPGTYPLSIQQPGVMGVALTQGIVYAVLLTLTAPVGGGYLNPGITIMLWVANRMDSARAAWLLGGQLLGAGLAGLCIRNLFSADVVHSAMMGTPHLNALAFRVFDRGAWITGTSIELVLTFFLVLAIFALASDGKPWRAGLAGGAVLAACVLAAFPLTGAATNPARWFGTVIWESGLSEAGRSPWSDAVVYITGPILGALLGGLFCFKVYLPLAAGEKK